MPWPAAALLATASGGGLMVRRRSTVRLRKGAPQLNNIFSKIILARFVTFVEPVVETLH